MVGLTFTKRRDITSSYRMYLGEEGHSMAFIDLVVESRGHPCLLSSSFSCALCWASSAGSETVERVEATNTSFEKNESQKVVVEERGARGLEKVRIVRHR